MLERIHLVVAARTAHALALELYRFTATWPSSDREGLTLEVRRAGFALAACLAEASERLDGHPLDRALDHARSRLARVRYLLRFASDLGYRKLSTGGAMDDAAVRLEAALDLVTWERSVGSNGNRNARRPSPGLRFESASPSGHRRGKRRSRRRQR